MPRLKTIEPSEAAGKAKELFEGPLKDKQFNIFKAMANSPAALNAYIQFNAAMSEGLLSDKEREAVLLAIGEANGCDYCTAAHTALGQQAGLSETQTLGARKGQIQDDPKLNALVRFSHALHEKRGWVDDADLDEFRNAGYTDGHVAEVVAMYAISTFTNYFNHVNQTPVDLPEAPALS